jgi:pimeloyl-ACP methyl ester carboxylesterase
MSLQKQTVIILHGWGHNAELWQKFRQKLESAGFDIIVEDLPGFGSRVNEAQDFDVPKYANWFKKNFVDVISKQKVILIGHSLGGRIALELAKENPTWLEKLILVGTPAIYEPSNKTKILKNLSFLKKFPGISSLVSSINPEYEAAKSNNLKETYQNVVGHNQKEILHLVQTPTLLVWGELDFTVPVSVAMQIKSTMPNSQLKIIPNSGHSPHLDNPDLLFGIIKKWL